MENITYLLGAGASANILPVIKDAPGKPGLPTALENFISSKKSDILNASEWNETNYQKLKDIVQKCKQFGTPDLAAKYYLERKDIGNYNLTKKLLSHYFSYTQNAPDLTGIGFESRTLDPRIVPFLSTIADKNKIPPNLKIISWNYDTQLEMGAKMLLAVDGVNDFDNNFNIWPFVASDKDKIDKNYFLLHLNGISGHVYSERNLASKIDSAFNFTDTREPLLSFAWEDDDSFNKKTFTDKRIELAKKMIETTTILVVIGYSFPFFNRKIDSSLFSFMKGTLRKIYFQDPVLDGQTLFGQFDLIKNNEDLMQLGGMGRITEIVHIKETNQYYIPYEL